MAASKMNKEDAQEWLESLQLVGEGWYRQVALAVRAGAHKALGMERREFARAIGQKMIDSRQAIIELHGDGHTKQAISDVLGLSAHTVHNVLVEEGLIEGDIRATGSIGAGSFAGERDDDESAEDGERDADLQTQIENLEAQIKGEAAKREREEKKMRERIDKLQEKIRNQQRELEEAAKQELSPEDRARLEKEAAAWAEEQGRRVLAGLSHLVVEHVVSALEEAANETRLLIEQGAITGKVLRQIDSAHAGFVEELNVARMSVSEEEVTA